MKLIKTILLPLSFCLAVSNLHSQESKIESDSLSFERKFKLSVFSEMISANVDTAASANTEQASLSFLSNYTGANLNYYFKKNMSISAGIGSMIYSSSAVQGNKVNIAYQYYFSRNPSETSVSTGNSSLSFTSKLSPFVSIGYSNSSLYVENVSVNFSGNNLGAGVEYMYNDKNPLSLEVEYTTLNSSAIRTLSGISVRFAWGWFF